MVFLFHVLNQVFKFHTGTWFCCFTGGVRVFSKVLFSSVLVSVMLFLLKKIDLSVPFPSSFLLPPCGLGSLRHFYSVLLFILFFFWLRYGVLLLLYITPTSCLSNCTTIPSLCLHKECSWHIIRHYKISSLPVCILRWSYLLSGSCFETSDLITWPHYLVQLMSL